MKSVIGQELESVIGEAIIRPDVDRLLGHSDNQWFRKSRYQLFLKQYMHHPTLEALQFGQMLRADARKTSYEHPAKMLSKAILEIASYFEMLELRIRVRSPSDGPAKVQCVYYHGSCYVHFDTKDLSIDDLFDLIDFCSDLDAFFLIAYAGDDIVLYSKLVCDGDGYVLAMKEPPPNLYAGNM